MTPAILLFAAQSGTGKTFLIERLVSHFSSRKILTGYIKHHHGAIINKKDSHLLKEAGVQRSLLIAQNTILIEDVPPSVPHSSSEFLDTIVGRYFNHVQLVLIEGFKNNLIYPKILISRDIPENQHWFLKHMDDKNIIAAVSEAKFFTFPPYPVFPFEDLNMLAGFICDYFNLYPVKKGNL